MAAFISYERALPQALRHIQSILETPMPANWIDIGHTGFGGMADYYEHDVRPIFASVADAQLQAGSGEPFPFSLPSGPSLRWSRSSKSWSNATRPNRRPRTNPEHKERDMADTLTPGTA